MNFTVDVEISGEGVIVMAHAISLLTILSLTAIFTTISLFFCGIPICVEIYRRKSTHEISALPFLMGLLGGSFWLRYGFLRADLTMISVNVVGVILMSMYLVFYAYHSKPRTSIIAKITIVVTTICSMLILVEIYGIQIIDSLGFVSMLFNVINFGSPLANVFTVFRKHCCDSLPLPLCVANFLVSAQWCLYGVLVQDIYIIIPNGAGVALALLQISLFLIFPRQAGGRAPLAMCFSCLDNWELDEKPSSDVEKAIAQDYWLKRSTICQSSLPPLSRIPKPKKNCLTLIRSPNIFPSGSVTSSRTDSTSITILPNWSLTPSVSHPELGDFSQEQSMEEQEREAMFNRIQEIEELDQQWTDNELRRYNSAPDMAESGVDQTIKVTTDALDLC